METGKRQSVDTDDFRKAIAPAIEWFKQNCDPHQMIIIENGIVRLTSDDIGIPFEIND